MTSVQDRLVAIVTSCPKDRRDVDIEIAIPWLRKKSELLQKLPKDTLKDVIKHCGYKKAIKDDVIITQGDLGDCFYIMLTGRMSVFIDTTRSDDEVVPGENKADEASSSPAGTKKVEAVKEKETDQADADEEEDGKEEGKPLNRSQFGKFIMYFEAGNSFGEIALISDNCVRNATIISDMESDLLIIHRDLFNTYIKASQVAEYEERRQFVNKCAMFQGWNSKFKGLLEMSLRKEAYPYGSVIVQQGAPVEGLVFIISGQAKINMDPSRHESQYEGLKTDTENLVQNIKSDKTPKAKNQTKQKHLTSGQIRIRRKYGYAAAERRVMTKNVDVCCIEKGDFIGAVEMVMDMDTCMETVVSTAATTVFILNAKNYDRLITRKHPSTTVRLTQWAHGRISTWCRSSVGSSIRLLKRLEKELKNKLPKTPPPAKQVEVLQKREVVMNQLLDMFRQDKVPLIEPCVPNALFYRIKSAQKTKALMENPYAQLRSLKNISDFGKIRRKVPRSIMQLKNNIEAERELLKDDRRELCDGFDTRPNTSIGFSRSNKSSAYHSRQRPRSAIVQSLRIKECGDEQYDFGSSSRDHPDTASRLDIETVAEIYEEMEQVTRENQENRMRLICSASAKRELKDNLAKAKSYNGLDKMGDLLQTEYFDWETSEENLKDLENRVDAFCLSMCPRRPSRVPSARPGTASSGTTYNNSNNNSNRQCNNKWITEMKRFQIEDPSTVPLPGGTVFVHKKPCRFPHAVLDNPGVHRHVRRFILSQEPDWTDLGQLSSGHGHH